MEIKSKAVLVLAEHEGREDLPYRVVGRHLQLIALELDRTLLPLVEFYRALPLLEPERGSPQGPYATALRIILPALPLNQLFPVLD